MGLFNFVSGWQGKLLSPLDAKMTETLNLGLQVAREKVHVRTGRLKASIGGGFNQSTKTILLWADEPYALVEEQRAPIPAHSYLGPAAQKMAGFWGGKFDIELHFPNAAPKGSMTTHADLADRESRWRKKNLGLLARARGKVKVVTRRWHKRMNDLEPTDPTTPIL